MELQKAKQIICETGILLQKEGLVARTWGNLSVRIDNDHFVISPSGLFYEHTRPEHISIVSIADLSWDGTVKPSSEKGLHALIYRDNPGFGAIVHTHQSAASSFAAARQGIGGEIPCASYAMPTTTKLAKRASLTMRNTATDTKGRKSVILANHGALCAAKTMKDAVSAALELERKAEHYVEKVYSRKAKNEKKGPSHSMVAAYKNARSQMKQKKSLKDLIFSRTDAETVPEFIRKVFHQRKKVSHIILSRLPYTRAFSSTGITLKPLLDDMAQIVGTSAGYVADINIEDQNVPGCRDAVFVRGEGALCFGKDEGDARAVQMVLEKSARSSIESDLLGRGYAISWFERVLMRLIYKIKYSRLSSQE